MIQFILYFFAIIGVGLIFYVIAKYFIYKSVDREMGKEYELILNQKDDIVCNSIDILTGLKGSQRNKWIFTEKFPTNNMPKVKDQTPPPKKPKYTKVY
jgi:hypothetical protein